MTCCSSRLASWLTRTVRGRRFVLRRGIGASVTGPMRIARPTRHQRCSREAVAIVRPQPIPWDPYRQIKRKFCTIVGGVVSPVLANLFLHYAFDLWMQRGHPTIPFERYADDAICHCASEAQALGLRQALNRGLRRVGCGCTRRRPRSFTARMQSFRGIPGAIVRLSRLHVSVENGNWPRPKALCQLHPRGQR